MSRFERELSGALGPFWRRSAEQELAEMRAAFGPGATVRDILTGEEIHL